MNYRIAVAAIAVMLGSTGQFGEAQTATIFVDGGIASASCTSYNPATRACSGGSSTAYRTLAGGAGAASAGTLVYIRAGSYSEQLNVPRSGTATQPIVFRRYGSETPTITNLSNPGILMVGRQYVEIDGLTVSNVVGWVRLEDSRFITIRNSVFRRATSSGTTGSVKLVRSSDNRILDNVLDDGNDNMVLVDGADRNLVQNNQFTLARHSLLSVRCSNFNVFRGNSFHNTTQKAVEIYDCEGGSDAPFLLDATKRNLFEDNVFTKTLASDADHRYNAMQHGAQHTIVRRNVYRGNDGGGVNYQSYSDESLAVYGNRMYHNTFYGNRCHAIIGDSGTSQYRDNRVKNNLLYGNVNCSGGGQQTNIRDAATVILTSNAIESSPPGFVNEAGNDFRLASGSRMIDAAAALTATAGAGSGSVMAVQDASYFFDGYGIAGEGGDIIQLLGGGTAVVLDIDYAANRLTLDRSLTWSAGQGVALQFSGSAPDMGAFEVAGPTSPGTAPQPPSNVRVIR